MVTVLLIVAAALLLIIVLALVILRKSMHLRKKIENRKNFTRSVSIGNR